MRAVFGPGKQRNFVAQVIAATGSDTLKDAARHLGVSRFRLGNWMKEKYYIPLDVAQDWAARFGTPLPDMVRTLEDNWGRVAAGYRSVELHGPPGTRETRLLGAKRAAELRRIRPPRPREDPAWVDEMSRKIRALYWDQRMSHREVARHVGWSAHRVRMFCLRHGIPMRSHDEALTLAKSQGKYSGRPHTLETRRLLRLKMHQRYASGWLATGGRCAKIRYHSPFAGNVTLDGTWELLVARLLDQTGIRWVRNRRGYRYVGRDGASHLYFPDFYLPDYELFVEVKGFMDQDARHKMAEFVRRHPGCLMVLHGRETFRALSHGAAKLVDLLGIHPGPRVLSELESG